MPWRIPLTPQADSAGAAVTAAALTGSGITPLPQIQPWQMALGFRLSLRATVEATSTSATPTLIAGFYIGGIASAIGSKAVLGVTAALPISASATAWPLILSYDGTFRVLSASAGAMNGQGKADSWINVGLSGDATVNPLPITAALRTVSTINTNVANEIDVGITLSSTTGSPSILVTNLWADISALI